MMFKCFNCGNLFEEGEEAVWYEDRGEFWGRPCTERMTGCPVCKCDYDEASECKECGEWHFSDELSDGLCKACKKEERDGKL